MARKTTNPVEPKPTSLLAPERLAALSAESASATGRFELADVSITNPEVSSRKGVTGNGAKTICCSAR